MLQSETITNRSFRANGLKRRSASLNAGAGFTIKRSDLLTATLCPGRLSARSAVQALFIFKRNTVTVESLNVGAVLQSIKKRPAKLAVT